MTANLDKNLFIGDADDGPEGGDGGGTIVIQGPPEKIAKSKRSRTAPFLAAEL